jgi:HSP20 family protein
MLTVSAERRFEQEDEDEIIVKERPQGRFNRDLRLGSAIDVDNIGASYEGGVLTLTLPVSERAKPRTIQVQARNEAPGEIEPGS